MVKIRAMPEAIVVFCTCPDEESAVRLAKGLLEGRAAACVNVLLGIRSIYRWQGALSEDTEVLMVIKSLASCFEELESWLLAHHPYEVPEIVALPASAVSADYMAWIESSVGK